MLSILENYHSRKLPTAFDLLDDFLSPTKYLDTNCYNNLGNPISYKTSTNGVQIKVAVPGYGKDDLELKFDKNILHLTNKTTEDKKEGLTKLTVNYKISLPKNINEETIKSKCENGMLVVDAEYNKPQEGRIIKIV